jgi:hypothetical protein
MREAALEPTWPSQAAGTEFGFGSTTAIDSYRSRCSDNRQKPATASTAIQDWQFSQSGQKQSFLRTECTCDVDFTLSLYSDPSTLLDAFASVRYVPD